MIKFGLWISVIVRNVWFCLFLCVCVAVVFFVVVVVVVTDKTHRMSRSREIGIPGNSNALWPW